MGVELYIKKLNQFHEEFPKFVSVFYTVLSSLGFSSVTLVVKLIPNVSTLQVIQTISIFQLILIWNQIQKQDFPTFQLKFPLSLIFFLRALSSLLTVICWFNAALLTSATETLIIYNMSPLWTCLYAVFIKRSTKLSFMMLSIFSLLFMGLYFLSMSTGDQNSTITVSEFQHKIGLILLLTSSLINSLIEICVKKLNEEKIKFITIYSGVLYVGSIGSSFLLTLAPNQLKLLTFQEIMALISISVIIVSAQFFYNTAFKYGELSTISILQLQGLLHGFLMDKFIFYTEVQTPTIIGAIFITIGLGLNVVKK